MGMIFFCWVCFVYICVYSGNTYLNGKYMMMMMTMMMMVMNVQRSER